MGFAAQPLASGPEPLPQAESHTVRTSQHYLQQTVARAITEFEQSSREDWSYRISRYENEEGISAAVLSFSSRQKSLTGNGLCLA
ncbi:hypothetical protein AT746_01610 [Lacimicrobium alkaliphilum]|uniref:Uncharacterized protein n=2 Tax=Lacimicrobium alkaliphilum TaxID=1526571 RepID=A0A0U3A7V8_9ALTE|nr:hypothetical protein AT746_01610 [Lacimicrobium alkaliphilum]